MYPVRGSVDVLVSATQASPSGSLSLALRGKLFFVYLLMMRRIYLWELIINNRISILWLFIILPELILKVVKSYIISFLHFNNTVWKIHYLAPV